MAADARVAAQGRRPVATARPQRPWALLVLASLNAVAALGGAWGLASGALSIGDRLEDRLPLGSPVLGGLALFVTVALPNAVLAVLAWRGDPRAGAVAVVVGLLLVGWIVVELAFLRELSFFHPLYLGIGLLMVWLGRRER